MSLRLNRQELKFNEAPGSFQEALQAFDLNWNVGLRPVFTANQEGDLKVIPGYKSVNRLDTDVPLSIVGARYEVVQNNRCADIVDEVVKGLGCRYVNGGLFGGGEKVFLQALFPDTIRVKGSQDDTIAKYLTFISSHDSSSPTVIGGSNTRVVCQNTFMMALADARRDVRIRHTSNAELRLTEAKDILKGMISYHNAVELRVNLLAATPFTDEMTAKVLRNVFKVDPKTSLLDIPTRTANSMNKVLDFAQSGLGIDSSNRGSAWGLFNAMTQWSNHEKTVKSEDKNPMNRMESLLVGSGADFNFRAQAAIESVAQLA